MPHMRAASWQGPRCLSSRSLVTPASGAVRRRGAASTPWQSTDLGGRPCTASSDSPTCSCCAPATALREGRGQGTVEYVALILLVALVMAGVVAAMKGFRTGEGKELGDVIIGKIKEAVKKVQF